MEWFGENWLLVLLGLGMVAMHLFGHRVGGGGCCGGGHGHSQGSCESEGPKPKARVKDDAAA